MIIGRSQSWYRPYYLGKYTIKNIVFYDENGTIIETGQGWLEYNKQDLDRIYLDVKDIPLKRKVDYSLQGAFYVSQGKSSIGNELEATLYIHKNLFNLEFVEYKKEFDNIRKYYKGATSDAVPFEISINVKYLKDEVWKKRTKLEQTLANFTNELYDIKEETAKLYIQDIKREVKDLLKAQKEFEEYSVDDYLKGE